MKIPNLKEILKPIWAHRVGYGFQGDKKVKLGLLEQGTTPLDKNLLKKLGIKKGDKVLVIAGYYASWASGLKNSGAKVDYSDISKEIVNWIRRNVKTKFGKYIISNYELIPKKENEYDWTFTYEACGGRQGLPIAYIHSLLNTKGGILIYFINKDDPKSIGGKAKSYPNIVKTFAKVYKTKYLVTQKKIIAHKRGKDTKERKFMLCKIYTNDSTKKKAKEDLITLKKESGSKESLKRLSKITKLFNPEFIKTLK